MFRSRSHQSSSSSSFRLPDPPSNISLKRGSHFIASNLSNSAQNSDLGVYRGKRRRRDNISPAISEKRSALFTCENLPQTNHEPTFATTSAQFDLFSRPASSGGKGRRNIIKPQHERKSGCLTDVVRLHSSAFWELRQSISENGEGLVRRMRDYERSRSRNHTHHKAKEAEKRDRKKVQHRKSKKQVFADASDASDDEDIVISSGESANHILRGTFLRKMQPPVDTMDVDTHQPVWPNVHETRNVNSAPYTTSMLSLESDGESNSSTSGTEVGDLFSLSPAESSRGSSPVLSHSADELSCSSPGSLLLPSSMLSGEDFSGPFLHSSAPSTTSEKALAALSLALANGAGSISDYSSVHGYQDLFLTESYDHGDLWH